MLDIPYETNPGKACALACYTMVARYFFPESSFDKIAKISNWQPGYVVWSFKFWLWIMDKGVKVVDYDLIDLKSWAEKGLLGLKESVSENEFEFYKNGTKDIESYSDDIKKVLSHPNFTRNRVKPTWEDLTRAFNGGGVCEVTLNSRVLNNEEGFALHRVVILDINEKNVTFHDPRKEPRPARQETIEHFKKSWLETVSEPELCIYKK